MRASTRTLLALALTLFMDFAKSYPNPLSTASKGDHLPAYHVSYDEPTFRESFVNRGNLRRTEAQPWEGRLDPAIYHEARAAAPG